MKKLTVNTIIPVFIFFSLAILVVSCSSDNTEDTSEEILNETLAATDKTALIFMLEEEKLARDTYSFLNNEWAITQFANIKASEQTHMDAIEKLLIQYNIQYTILPEGQFNNANLQTLYNQFAKDGAISQYNALQIGATIEDLDIVDLQDFIDATENTNIISVFKNLQCGSRNHLRSFVSTIENSGSSYTPQYLTQDAYNSILSGSREQCNQ